MKIAVFSAKPYDKQFFEEANKAFGHTFEYFEPHLNVATAKLATGFEAVCAFVNDIVDREVLRLLAAEGIRMVALRCAGFNNVDLDAAREFNIRVARVPAYSPYAVAEHTVALALALNRKIHRAHNRVREGNFSLDGLLGFDFHGKAVGIVGTGKIGQIVAKIFSGFGCRLLAHDPHPDADSLSLGVEFVSLPELYRQSDIITLHCPLTPQTRHLIDAKAIAQMKPGVMLINTSRGAIIDTQAAIEGLKSRKIGYLGLDVYEEEGDLFFEDLSNHVIRDDVFARLQTFPNVLITGHQGFFTQEALENIAHTTLENIACVQNNRACPNELTPVPVEAAR